jgi:hypothetical protein
LAAVLTALCFNQYITDAIAMSENIAGLPSKMRSHGIKTRLSFTAGWVCPSALPRLGGDVV